MAASDAMTDAVTTSESLPSYYTYPDTHGCLEHVSLMRQEWSDEGWFVQSVGVLKVSGDYKVCVTYAQLVSDTNTSNNFTETLWREANYNWKPTGVTITPRDENRLTMWWSRRSDGAQLREGVKRLRLKACPLTRQKIPRRLDHLCRGHRQWLRRCQCRRQRPAQVLLLANPNRRPISSGSGLRPAAKTCEGGHFFEFLGR